MNHEWNHEIQEWNHEKHERHEKRREGGEYEPRMDTNNRSRGKFPISAVPSFLLVPLTEKAVGFWVFVTPWLDGF